MVGNSEFDRPPWRSEEETRLDKLPRPAYAFIMASRIIDLIRDEKYAEELRIANSIIFERLSITDRAEVLSFNAWEFVKKQPLR